MKFFHADGLRITRGELSGAFGDIGTDLPLITGMVLATGMNPASVLTVFGLAQIFSALIYGIPMPVQPLKAVAALAIAGEVSAMQVYGAGLGIGVSMLVLTATGWLERLRRFIPKAVIRGIQLGLGLKLGMLALTRYIPAEGGTGLVLAAVSGVLVLLLLRNRRCPPALPVIGLGLVYAFCFKLDAATWRESAGFNLPQWIHLSVPDILGGYLILALPQIPLSLGNSLFATHQMAHDLFPERKVKLRTIGYSYSLYNIVVPFFGGVPVCHGSGGMAGHYAFGGRTGGSVLLYGVLLLMLGLFFGNGFEWIIHIFPLPVLGVILLVESGMLMQFVRDLAPVRFDLFVAGLTAVAAVLLPYGFLAGMLIGTAVAHAPRLRMAWRANMQPLEEQ
ncbi:MAG: putative sulfate/molybdate transporter [Alphaproteobacteria bacterium]